MNKKFMTLIGLMLALSIFLVACSGGSNSEPAEADANDTEDAATDAEVTLKLAHSGSETHQYHIAAEKFKEEIEASSNGTIAVEIYSGSVLGNEGEAVEQVLDGTLDLTTVSADSSFANTVPEMNVFGIPYLFEDLDHVYETLDGEVGKELLELSNQKGMKALGYWEVGQRHVTNDKVEVKTPADMSGLNIRVQPAPVWEAHMRAIGASPTPVAFNELYSALDQGVVDGQENPLNTIYAMKFYEVQKYVSLTAHTFSPAIVVMSERAWGALSAEQQQLVEDAVQAAKTYQRETLMEKNDQILAHLEESGVTITSDIDFDAFREATKEVRDVLSSQVPAELIEKIEK
ncbi:DctP family TRAP transporter solute-binding subunit [Halalkalibacter alkalisediminis]|uniref:DctP family TRAP transporter solute-binding subunit n=1 Tax=Halalkalibacter alkalisediminis TaxID=935616 RepID=A0ABV6NIP5_9BACI|nr:DctP family TRAP transporter solute-binding subunit [Halalkalibacter alkalisediminis]